MYFLNVYKYSPFFANIEYSRKYFDEIKEILLPELVRKAQTGAAYLEVFMIDYASKVFRGQSYAFKSVNFS